MNKEAINVCLGPSKQPQAGDTLNLLLTAHSDSSANSVVELGGQEKSPINYFSSPCILGRKHEVKQKYLMHNPGFSLLPLPIIRKQQGLTEPFVWGRRCWFSSCTRLRPNQMQQGQNLLWEFPGLTNSAYQLGTTLSRKHALVAQSSITTI